MSKERTLIIDADVLRYQLAFANTSTYDFDGDNVEATSPEVAKVQLEDYVEELMDTLGGTHFVLPLSVKANFRKQLYPAYKANRAKKPKPALWYEVDKFLHELWGDRIVTSYGLEGDDIIGLMATMPRSRFVKGKAVVVSIDKDMNTLPGIRLYDPNKPDLGVRPITEEMANYFWMYQTLTGDSTDNYPGCPGIGPKRADQALGEAVELEELWKRVVETYESKGFTADDALLQARLARILRHGDYDFKTRKVRLWEPNFTETPA